jgi:hypothetical protein
VNAPTANTVAAAEHGIALICALSRNVAQADASMKAGKWERNKYVGVSIVGKTLAVMGFGKVTGHHTHLLPSTCARMCPPLRVQAVKTHSECCALSRSFPHVPANTLVDECLCLTPGSHLHDPLKASCSESVLQSRKT